MKERKTTSSKIFKAQKCINYWYNKHTYEFQFPIVTKACLYRGRRGGGGVSNALSTKIGLACCVQHGDWLLIIRPTKAQLHPRNKDGKKQDYNSNAKCPGTRRNGSYQEDARNHFIMILSASLSWISGQATNCYQTGTCMEWMTMTLFFYNATYYFKKKSEKEWPCVF